MTVVIADSVADSVQEDKKHTKRNMDKNNGKLNPRHSMSVIYAYIGVVLGVNVGIYGIHGVSGNCKSPVHCLASPNRGPSEQGTVRPDSVQER